MIVLSFLACSSATVLNRLYATFITSDLMLPAAATFAEYAYDPFFE